MKTSKISGRSQKTSRNIQYDIYKDTKDVLKAIRNENEDRLQNHLISQGSFFRNIIDNSTSTFNCLWSSAQSKLPKNIFNFTVRYINNALPTRKNLLKWGLHLPLTALPVCNQKRFFTLLLDVRHI